jgi:lysyl-tRNA synthetase class 2
MKPEKKPLDLTEDEKVVHDLLIIHVPIDLNELKTLSGLSNKKWDKAFKGLVKKRLANYNREDNMVGLILQASTK